MGDYCMAKPEPQPKGAPPRTPHGGMCSWRGDILHRLENDPKYHDASGKLDLKRVPVSDRLGVEAMIQYRGDPHTHALCDETEHSGHFAVCPVVEDPDRPEMGTRGWLALHSWDFCTARPTPTSR